MFEFLKPKKKPPSNENYPLINALQVMVYDPSLQDIFYNRESRITLLNTYSENLSDLVDKTYRNELGVRLLAVNLHNYLYNTNVERLKAQLNKLISYLGETDRKINTHTKADLNEIIEAYTLLKKG